MGKVKLRKVRKRSEKFWENVDSEKKMEAGKTKTRENGKWEKRKMRKIRRRFCLTTRQANANQTPSMASDAK